MTKTQTKKQGKYGKVSGAKAQKSGNYVRDGHYVARIDAVREDNAFKKGDFIANEMTIVKTFEDSTPGFDYSRKVEKSLHAPGESTADILMVSNVAFEGRMKAFVMAAGNLTEQAFADEDYPGAIIDEVLGEEQPLVGRAVEFRATTVIKRDARQKTEEDLTNNDVYTRIDYVRQVPASELGDLLGEDVAAKFFPDLEEAIADENS